RPRARSADRPVGRHRTATEPTTTAAPAPAPPARPPATDANARVRRRWRRKASGRRYSTRPAEIRQHARPDLAGLHVVGHDVAIGRGDRGEGAAVVDGGAEPRERLEMLGHAVALVMLEAVAGIEQAQPRHEPVARDFGDDGGGGD